MSNTDSISFKDVCPTVSVRENERMDEIGMGANPHWHQPTEVYETYSDSDFVFGFNIVRMTCGTVVELAGIRG